MKRDRPDRFIDRVVVDREGDFIGIAHQHRPATHGVVDGVVTAWRLRRVKGLPI